MHGDELRTFLNRPEEATQRPGALGRVAGLLPSWAVAPSRSAATAVMSPRSRRRLEEVGQSSNIRLHLGCGFEHKSGWTNIDLVGSHADIFWDLRRGIPFEDNSVDAIFHEHLLEHLPMQTGLSFTDECFRVLKPGGTLRVVVPDAGQLIRAYATGDTALLANCPTALLTVQSMFYGWGHVAMYDADTLTALLESAGFSDVTEYEFGQSSWPDPPDTEARRAESLYVEGRKPQAS